MSILNLHLPYSIFIAWLFKLHYMKISKHSRLHDVDGQAYTYI